MVLLISDRIERELDKIMYLNHHDILDKVVSGLNKILNNLIIGVLNTRNGNVANL